MTDKELIRQFNKEFGFKPWPDKYEVDAETYGYCCQAVFNNALEHQFPIITDAFRLQIAVGPNNGLMFKNVGLILKGRSDEKV